MVLKLYDTLSREIKEIPSQNGTVSMYACGPTLYDYAHIGNWRTFIINDLVGRALKFDGLTLRQTMNVTDVDDKTIAGSKQAGQPLGEFTKKYEEIFLQDRQKLNLEPPANLTRATEYIPAMVEMIETLLKQNQAYQIEDGIYFRVNSFKDYGKLSRQVALATDRSDDENQAKEDPRDFALWKFQTPEDGEVGWDTPFGKGRPGWHIECSAMTLKTLGPTIDLHTGASDLIFPHHENEIAQSESANGAPFARHWLHFAFLQVEGEKMSKSLHNIFTLRDIEERGFPPLAFRYLVLTAHYRSLLNFTWESLGAAQSALQKLYDFYLELGEKLGTVSPSYRSQLEKSINDDLNLPQAVALVWDLIKDPQISNPDKKATLLEFDRVLGLSLAEQKLVEIPAKIEELAQSREQARAAQNWAEADKLRQEIETAGWEIKDTETGPKLKPKRV